MKKRSFFLLLIICSLQTVRAQNVGIGTTNPQATLDVNGDLIFRNTALALVNGANEDINTTAQKFSHYTISGPTSVFEIGGLTGGIDGRMITLYNSSPFLMIIKHLSAGSLAANEIHTGLGIDFTLSSYSSVTFRYQALDNLWHIASSHNEFVTGGGSSFWTASGVNIFNNNTGNVGIKTNTPTYPFTLATTGIGFSQESPDGATKIGFWTTSNAAYLQTHTNTDLFFATNNSLAKMTLKTSGQVGIGTSTPNAQLSVIRGTGVDGTAAFYGTTHISHFNYATLENTYIRAGKSGSTVFLNDSHNGNLNIATGGGNVNVGNGLYSSQTGLLNLVPLGVVYYYYNVNENGEIRNAANTLNQIDIANIAGNLATGGWTGTTTPEPTSVYWTINIKILLSPSLCNQYTKIIAIGDPSFNNVNNYLATVRTARSSFYNDVTNPALLTYYKAGNLGLNGTNFEGTIMIYGIK
jgi:hypothetical protein